MPPKKKVDETEPDGPNAAQAAAAEAGVVEATPDVPKGMVAVPFRGQTLICLGPNKSAQSYKVHRALAKNDMDKFMAALVPDQASAQIEALIDEDVDSYGDVVTEFFEAYGKATGQGNS